MRQYAAVTPKPFRVALPAYGMALLGFDAQGAQVESESSLRVAGNGRELTVAPQQIADFLQTLAQQTPPRLRGIIWFRLPLADDRRAVARHAASGDRTAAAERRVAGKI